MVMFEENTTSLFYFGTCSFGYTRNSILGRESLFSRMALLAVQVKTSFMRVLKQ